ncbi:YwqI/YxiC family protein [Virgibacillus sp. MSJ-26]|uniref:YwqI/YxiC family protein n=1 Tax=Virgibacillus sp. MSJ-26 TaxID=2841522 RepID=UPI001C126339|nr:YwqI/YxiC family protein [Virgibacillus sp. MSJ-26]MBU5465787.1 YwqI/YxiC family protein [Virgibacillus sp. MSJ-26]
MEKELQATGGGSSEIKLDYEHVISTLENAEQALPPLFLSNVYEGINGANKLEFIEQWLEREEGIRELLNQYIEIVEKNIEDTKANVKTIKEQDEAITRT